MGAMVTTVRIRIIMRVLMRSREIDVMGHSNENEEIEIDLRELLYQLLRKWWLIALCAVLGFASAVLITKVFITPQYQSKALLYILSKTTSVTSLADIQVGNALSNDFVIIAKSKPVLDSALEELSDYSDVLDRDVLLDMLEVSNQSDTRILAISATHENAVLARDVANAIATATAEHMSVIMQTDPPTILERAEAEEVPVSPSTLRNALVGILVGLVLSVGGCIVAFLINDRIHGTKDIESVVGINILATIPIEKDLMKDQYKRQDSRNKGKLPRNRRQKRDKGGRQSKSA